MKEPSSRPKLRAKAPASPKPSSAPKSAGGNDQSDAMPDHIEQSVQAIARLHANHHKRATPLELVVDRMTAVVARPAFIGAVTFAVIGWIAVNLAMQRLLGWRLDPTGFPNLQGLGELAAIYITTLVLMSQRRKDELSELREQLTLELAILTEQKAAKLIALSEEMRRDNPQLADRIDHQARAMSKPADPEAVLDAFKETHEEMIAEPAEPEVASSPPTRKA
jgi:uncharacterized membrane protein